MEIPLYEAPFDTPLTVRRVKNTELEAMLTQLGLFRGQTCFRQSEEVLLHPIRVRAAQGDVVLGGGMAARVIVRRQDGRRMPLTDLTAGQTGHIEGTTCEVKLAESLAVLGLRENDAITYLRQLPHMDYIARVGKKRRERLTEGMAAKIWGRIDDRFLQFVSAGKGHPFVVEKIIGGNRAARALAERGIVPGETIFLEAVAPTQSLAMTVHEPVVITTDDGLHLHLRPGQANRIYVKLAENG
jgi:Fe2+ transport system protein FeoA